jgi:hypothetical protein
MMRILWCASVLAYAAVASVASAQKKDAASDGPIVIKVDLATAEFDKTLPFDSDFYVVISNDKIAVQSLTVARDVMGGLRTLQGQPLKPLPGFAGVTDQAFKVAPLQANKRYTFTFQIMGAPPLVVHGSTRTTLNDYFRIDVGFIHAPVLVRGTDKRVSYWGGGSNVHLYLVSVNEASEKTAEGRPFDPVLKRVSLFGGVSAFDLHAGAPIKPFFKAGNPVAGVSWRPMKLAETPFVTEVYVNLGLMWFKQANPNPLVSDDVGKRTVVYGLAGSIAIKDLLTPLAFLFAGEK